MTKVLGSFAINAITDKLVILGGIELPTPIVVSDYCADSSTPYEIEAGCDEQSNDLFVSAYLPLSAQTYSATFTDADGLNPYTVDFTHHIIVSESKIKDHPIHRPHKVA